MKSKVKGKIKEMSRSDVTVTSQKKRDKDSCQNTFYKLFAMLGVKGL